MHVGQKVIADMFGLAPRSFPQKTRRRLESATNRGRSLWEAIYDYLQQKQVGSQSEVLMRFARDYQVFVHREKMKEEGETCVTQSVF